MALGAGATFWGSDVVVGLTQLLTPRKCSNYIRSLGPREGEKKTQRNKRKEKEKSLVLSAKRYSIFPLVPCIDSLGFPYPASWGRAF